MFEIVAEVDERERKKNENHICRNIAKCVATLDMGVKNKLINKKNPRKNRR